MKCRLTWLGLAPALLLLFTMLTPAVQAGPPLLCWPFEIGNAASLPMAGGEWRAMKTDYDLRRLEADTLALLTPSTAVIVRMETLRRATVYAMENRPIAEALLARLQERMLHAQAEGKRDALCLFDVGYLIEIGRAHV